MRSRWLLAVQLAATLFSALFSLDDRWLLPSPILGFSRDLPYALMVLLVLCSLVTMLVAPVLAWPLARRDRLGRVACAGFTLSIWMLAATQWFALSIACT